MIRSASQFVLAAMLSLAVPALAAAPASVSGIVQDSNHAPLMGVVVELFGSVEAFPLLTAFTDIHGHYQFSDLAPGRYSIRVLQAYSVPAHRKNIQVGTTTHAIVNLSLMSLIDVSQWFPAVPRAADESPDDWKWLLRSGVNRPILRWTDQSNADRANEQPAVDSGNMQRANGEDADRDDTADEPDAAHPIRVRAALTAGSSQFGEGGFRQEAFFRMREGNSSEAVVHMQSSTSGAGFVAAGMERDPLPGDTTRAVASFRTLPVDFGTGLGRLQIFQVRGGEQLSLSDAVVAQFGAETEAVQAGNNATAALPFMALHLQQAGNEVTYSLATATDLQGLTDLASSGAVPAMAMQDGSIRLTHSLHQEVSIQRKMAGLQLEAAYFYDHFVDPVLNGYGDASAAEFSSGDVLLDPVTGAFRSVGPNYSGGGFRVFAARQLKGNLWTAVEYAEGPAIQLPTTSIAGQANFADALSDVAPTRTQSVLVSLHGRVRGTSGARWTAGYRWQPEQTITAVDPFNAGMNAPYLSVMLRQPVGTGNSSPDRLELEFVMQNILAQGYRPIYIVDGQTLFFAQAPRLVTGGLAFSF
ncbi:MAG: carboxypeptidase-like regulatory domain-containing protein [Acidobacteriaceae bacterium]